jgi:hypothetical protein
MHRGEEHLWGRPVSKYPERASALPPAAQYPGTFRLAELQVRWATT